MKTSQKFVPIEEVIAGQPHKLADGKLEILNRARLDALGEMLQASHQCDVADEEVIAANRLFLKREKAWRKADRAFFAYVERVARQ
jgi:hypothetical protein